MVAIKPKKTTGGGASKQPAKPKLLKTKADKQAAVLEALEEGYTMRSAAAWGGICERTLRDWRKADPDWSASLSCWGLTAKAET